MIRDLIWRIKCWWRWRKYDRLTRMVLATTTQEAVKILDELRRMGIQQLEEEFAKLKKDQKLLKAITYTKNRQETRLLLQPIMRRIKNLILLPYMANLEVQKPKEK